MDKPCILFDVMQTLVTEPFLEVMPSFFGMSPDEFLTAKHPTSWIEFEEGTMTESDYFTHFFKDGRSIDGPRLRDQMKAAYRWIEGMEQLLADLDAAGNDIHALSNYSVWFEMIEESLGVSHYINWSFVSCKTGVRKPDRQAFLGAAEWLGVSPNRCLFIDDRQENVRAARTVGMTTILFSNANQLRRELAELHIL